MHNLQILIAIAFAVALVAFIYTNRRRNKTHHLTSRKNHPPGTSTSQSSVGIKAEDFLVQIAALRNRNSQWSEILSVLNPKHDPRIQELLMAIRGPHMFAPHTALIVIEDGCRSVKPKATVIEALEAAREGMNKVVRFGD